MAFKCLYVFPFCGEQVLADGNVLLIAGDDDDLLDDAVGTLLACLCWEIIFS